MDFKFFCPYCGQHIEASTDNIGSRGTCPTCSQPFTVPEPPTSSSSSPPPAMAAVPTIPSDFSDTEIANIAKWQKAIIWLVIASFIAFFIPQAFWITGIISLVFIYLLARALRSNVAWLYAVLGLIPLVGLIVLLVINNKATQTLKRRGIRVGLMGAKRSDIPTTNAAEAVFSRPVTKRSFKPAVMVALILVGIVVLWIILTNFGSSSHQSTSQASSSNQQHESPEQILAKQLAQGLNENKQKIFDAFHPVGKATSVTVHEVSINWKNGHPVNSWDDMQQFTVRYTLYWTSPLHDDGFTKITSTFDNETKRYISSQILATNGSTNEDAGNLLGTVLGGVLQYEAQKAGSEQAVQNYLNNQ